MSNRTRLRNAGIASFVVILVMLLATVQLPAIPAQAQGGALAEIVQILPANNQPPVGDPGGLVTIDFELLSRSEFERSFTIQITGLPAGYNVVVNSPIIVPPRVNATTPSRTRFTATLSIPDTQAQGQLINSGRVSASSGAVQAEPAINISNFFQFRISGTPPTNTPTTTGTTAPATSTPTTGPVCSDGFEPDGNPASARALDVQTSQQHAICPVGDEDWVVFGGVAGKTYTIDITRMDAGIDLSLELFDSELRSIAFNDDFFNRDPANPNPADIKPRITIRIPADGRYYVRIRDNAGRGGVNYIYVVALIDESYGPTPTQVASICQDLFEPDGLPEQADLITSNELQEDRKLCPAGDADWVTFFGKAGKRYVLFTDTRRYRGRNTVNGETQAGADTVIVLTDRDGVSLIDVNDDIPGGSTLDSQLEFTPEVDGFYFLQIKNVGDIGNQFIRYDLTLLLCLPGQTDCGRASAVAPTTAPATPASQGTPQPSATPNEFDLDTPEAQRPQAPAALPARTPLAAPARQAQLAPTPLAAVARPGL